MILKKTCEYQKRFLPLIISLFISLIYVPFVSADVVVNILAVNGTEEQRDKEINFALPAELSAEDILDTAGLTLEYNVTEGRYYAKGKVALAPKESKTLKLRLRDLWQYDEEQIGNIKTQIQASFNRMEGTEYAQTAKIRQDSLNDRLNYILQEMERADSVEKRMDVFRAYEQEFQDIRNKAVSIKYWRAKPPDASNRDVVKFVVNVENTSGVVENSEKKKHYLPEEVKPEHFIDLLGFQYRFDPDKGQPYLSKKEDLQAGETKKYTIDIIDVWRVPQQNVENLKDRTRNTYKLLEDSEYVETANFLVASIKEKLDSIEASQAEDKEIKEHISAFRANEVKFDQAKKDVEALEELLEALREELERSPMRNVLQRIKQLKSVQDVAQAIFGTKPTKNNAWRIITITVICVGLLTLIHFMIWGSRSKNIKKEDFEEAGKEKTTTDEENKA